MSSLAFIPAKGTSARLPGKNLLEIGGRSLIARAVEVAVEAQARGLVDEIMVVTDSAAVAQAALAAGPVRLHWPTKWRQYEGGVRDLLADLLAGRTCAPGCDHGPADRHNSLVVLWPTSPLRTVEHLEASKRLLAEADVVMSVVPFRQNPKWALTQPGKLEGIEYGPLQLSTLNTHPDCQHPLYRHDGTALWLRATVLPKLHPSFYGVSIAAYLLRADEAVDVDTALDALFAEFLLGHKERTTP